MSDNYQKLAEEDETYKDDWSDNSNQPLVFDEDGKRISRSTLMRSKSFVREN